jgi:hypothetical protein
LQRGRASTLPRAHARHVAALMSVSGCGELRAPQARVRPAQAAASGLFTAIPE